MNNILAYLGWNRFLAGNQQQAFISKSTETTSWQNIGKGSFFIGIISAVASHAFRISSVPSLAITFVGAVVCFYSPKNSKKLGKEDPLVTEEFRTLLHKVKSLNSFKSFDMQTIYPDCQSAREILIGSNSGANEIFIKKPTGKEIFLRQPYAKQDQLAFMISHRLNLNVVPATMACEGYKSIFDRTSEAVKSNLFNRIDDSYKGIVIQESVPLLSNQFQMNKDYLKPRSYFEIDLKLSKEEAEKAISEQCNRAISELALDINNICQAIVFNIVVGRTDAGRRNSIIDSFSKIREIDSEYIGGEKTDSWLLDIFSDCILNRKLIDNILAIEDSVLESIFKDLECFQPTFFWNNETYKFDVVDRTEENIITNFKRLKGFLSKNKEKNIQIKDLKGSFYRQGVF